MDAWTVYDVSWIPGIDCKFFYNTVLIMLTSTLVLVPGIIGDLICGSRIEQSNTENRKYTWYEYEFPHIY